MADQRSHRLRTRRALRRLPRGVTIDQLGDRRLVVARSFKAGDLRLNPSDPLPESLALGDHLGGLLARGLVVCEPPLTVADINTLKAKGVLSGKTAKKKAAKKKAKPKTEPKPEPSPETLDAFSAIDALPDGGEE